MKATFVASTLWIVLHHVAMAQDFYPLGQGLNGPVYELTVHGTDLYVGGDFTDAGGNPDADYIARWDGEAWHAVGPGLTGPVRAIAYRDSILYVGGEFAGDLNHVAVWNGSSWQPLAAGLNGPVFDLAFWQGEFYAGGAFPAKIARWTGSDWQPAGSSMNGPVFTLAATRDYLVAGGEFAEIEGVTIRAIAKWDGQNWSALSSSTRGFVRNIVAQGEEVFLAGHIGTGCPERMVGHWNGDEINYFGDWCELGHDVAVSGEFLFVSMYDFIGGEDRLLRWNLDTHGWDYLGIWFNTGTEGAVLAVLGDDLYVGGSFENLGSPDGDHIVRWGDAVTGTTAGDPQAPAGLRVFPSPADDVLRVEMEDGGDPGRLRGVFDVSGTRMMVGPYRDGTLDVTGLLSGVYHVVIETPQGLHATCFIKR